MEEKKPEVTQELVHSTPFEGGELTPYHLIMRALEVNPDPAILREMLAVRREYEADEARKAFVKAKTAFKKDCPAVLARVDPA